MMCVDIGQELCPNCSAGESDSSLCWLVIIDQLNYDGSDVTDRKSWFISWMAAIPIYNWEGSYVIKIVKAKYPELEKLLVLI